MTDTHACPCGCGGPVPPHQLACKPGWLRLPTNIRRAVSDAWRRHGRLSAEHRQALTDALQWYRDNPRSA